MKMKNLIKLTSLLIVFAACDDVFEPQIENNRDLDALLEVNSNAMGLMIAGYSRLPYINGTEYDIATDDALTNDEGSYYRKAAIGGWTSYMDPFGRYAYDRQTLQYLNIFFEKAAGQTVWSTTTVDNQLLDDRFTGEAYALRAIHLFDMLRRHAGPANGTTLGVPNLTHSETAGDNFNVSRASFQECIDQIYSDFEEAKKRLVLDNDDIKNSEIPQRFKDLGVTSATTYNRVYGSSMRGRLSNRIIEAIEAQVALFAASPAYNGASDKDWNFAAEKAAVVLDRIGGVAGLDPHGNTWYANADEIDKDVVGGYCPKEILWRGDRGNDDNNLEISYYPPSLNGNGSVNPSQNLVDAFPMKNGYPITDDASGYNPSNPYQDRDPRLGLYIVYDGAGFGPVDGQTKQKSIISTAEDAITEDGLNKSVKSTKTGYYLRKHVREETSLSTGAETKQFHYMARIRYTEIFLDYAEAANEAWGPDKDNGHGYSAYTVIKAIRQRGGIENDDYLESIKTDKNKMRELIRNERRIELCFENHRFWDLRRWKANLTEPVKGVRITGSGSTKKYEYFEVEKRDYKDYMYCCPIPEEEILKWSALIQNDGWSN
ncbi:MAG: RagB/SusD family nutrient uptake outer membrane protein [Salinivirgaceae bacterium]|nr:RagB/SusD family nutrient uptake outer membrane protein [Salinivirgaceae bacterium]